MDNTTPLRLLQAALTVDMAFCLTGNKAAFLAHAALHSESFC
jgi:hypothetical protein